MCFLCHPLAFEPKSKCIIPSVEKKECCDIKYIIFQCAALLKEKKKRAQLFGPFVAALNKHKGAGGGPGR